MGRLTRHHITGRIHGRPIHESFVVLICGACNNGQFILWKVTGIDDAEPTVAVLLRRIACWLAISEQEFDHMLADVLEDLSVRLDESA